MKYLLILSLLFSVGCLRMKIGEDIYETTEDELTKVKRSLTYFKDKKGLCYSLLTIAQDGFRTNFSFTNIDCKKVGL